MKVMVATMERTERREMPQTPCPLVHPLPSRVPKPTINPAAISSGAVASTLIVTGANSA